MDGLYFALPDVTWKLVFAVCFGTGIFMTTPSANIFAPKTLLTWTRKQIRQLHHTICYKFYVQGANKKPWHSLPCVFYPTPWWLAILGREDLHLQWYDTYHFLRYKIRERNQINVVLNDAPKTSQAVFDPTLINSSKEV